MTWRELAAKINEMEPFEQDMAVQVGTREGVVMAETLHHEFDCQDLGTDTLILDTAPELCIVERESANETGELIRHGIIRTSADRYDD